MGENEDRGHERVKLGIKTLVNETADHCGNPTCFVALPD